MNHYDSKTIDKEVVVNDDDFFVVDVVAPSNKKYCISLCNKHNAEKHIVMVYPPENEEYYDIYGPFQLCR